MLLELNLVQVMKISYLMVNVSEEVSHATSANQSLPWHLRFGITRIHDEGEPDPADSRDLFYLGSP